MRSSNLIAVLSLAFVTAFAVIAAPAAASDRAPAQPQAATVAPPLGDCPPAGAAVLAAVLEPAEAPVCSDAAETPAAGPFVEPAEQKGPPPIRRYCRCGCGIGCETDADCGEGGSCVAFVTCC